MAEEHTPSPGAANHGNEPTQPIPDSASAGWPPPTPSASPWAPQPAAAEADLTAGTGAQPVGSEPTVQLPVSDQPLGAYSYPAVGQQSAPPAQPYPTSGAPTAGPTYWNYGQPTQAPYYQAGGYPPPGQGYSGYPPGGQYGNYYPPPGYQQSPVQPPAPKRRWPALLVSLVLAFGLAVAGYTFVSSEFGAAPSTRVTSPAQPGSGQSHGSAGTQSKTVTAAEAKGVALIEATTANGTAYGTGVVLTADGKVLTNYHVVAGTEKVAVTMATSGDTYVATVLGFDQTRDVALLQLKNASGLDTVTIDTNQVSTGDQIAAVGNAAGGMKLVKATGTVTGTDQALTVNSDSPWGSTEDLSGLVATSAGAVPGDSGGPMFDSQSEVLGITTAGSTKDHSSYAVPISTALAVVQQVETGQDAGTVRVGPAGYLGVRVADASYTGSGGATVTAVVANSPAANAGITAGSQITKVGDTQITNKTNVASVIRAVEPGQQVAISWITSSGHTKNATVTMGSSPVN
jgi:S1-C subfamily serine protease